MDYSRTDLAERLAADYVAGTLRGAARHRFEALLPAHAALRGAVRGWEARLMPLTGTVAPVAPPKRVWRRIEQRLFAAPAANPATTAAPWWARLAFWRGFAALASVATLSLAVLLASPQPVPPPVVVVLNPTSAPAGGVMPAAIVASISGDGRAVVTRPLVEVSLAADRALELWAVPPQGAPRSLGLISARGASVVQRSRVPPGTDALAVSLEPPGGSPTGAPTGPILYAGKLTL